MFSVKFGDDIESQEQIYQRFEQIKDMGINLHGIHFHCGSAQSGSNSFQKAIRIANECMEIGKMLGHEMQVLDLGGGFPSG